MRARSITTHCAQNFDEEKSMCMVDRDVFVTPGTNDEALFTIKYVCIYETEMIGPPIPWPLDQVATMHKKTKERSPKELAKLQRKIEKRRKLARKKAKAKKRMEMECAAKDTEQLCSVGCVWNPNNPPGEKCKLCRGLSRKSPQYDEADVCLADHFTLSCDDRGIKARIFVREVLQDNYPGAIPSAQKDYTSKYRARRITMFCATGKNFKNNRCKFRKYQFAGGEVSQGVTFTIKYACFYANNLPPVPRIYINLNDTTPQELALQKRLQMEAHQEVQAQRRRKKRKEKKKQMKEEAKAEAQRQEDQAKKEEEHRPGHKKGTPGGWFNELKRWWSHLWQSKRDRMREEDEARQRRKERIKEIMRAMKHANETANITHIHMLASLVNGTLYMHNVSGEHLNQTHGIINMTAQELNAINSTESDGTSNPVEIAQDSVVNILQHLVVVVELTKFLFACHQISYFQVIYIKIWKGHFRETSEENVFLKRQKLL